MAASSPSEASSSLSPSENDSAPQSKSFTVQEDASEDQVKTSAQSDEPMQNDTEETKPKAMLNPILTDLERRVTTSSNIFDRSNKQTDVERKRRMKKLLSPRLPEALKRGGDLPDSVLTKLEQLVFFTEVEGTDEVQLQEHVKVQELDPVGKTALVAHSLKAFLTTLPEPDLRRVVTKLNADCQLWLSRLFRFDNSNVMYHDDEREGLVRICRLALYHSYPKYATDGFDALYSRPPVIYISAAARPGLGHYLCLQLGLPLSCICTVPCNTVFGASSKMDVAMLEKMIQDDLAAAKTPVLLLAFAGTPAVGHVDNLSRLQDICKANSVWLHVEGNHLATLTLFTVPSEVSSAKSGDSITVCPGTWLGVPGLPCLTLFKASDGSLVHAAGLNAANAALKLNCLPYWMCLLTIGHDGMASRLTHACDLAKLLYDRLDPITTISQISRDKKEAASRKQYNSLVDLVTKAISALLLFEIASPTVVFRYAEDAAGPGVVVAPYAAKSDEQNDRSEDSIYYDALNIWLAEALQHSDPKVPVDTVEVQKVGVCIRYCPLESAQAKGTTKEDLEAFVRSLISNLSVLNASTQQRKRFQSIVQSQPNLCLVHLENWAGLGAVSYMPDMYLEKEELGEKDVININNLNAEVLHQLKAKDAAFSLGHTEDGKVCVKFGLINQNTDVDELIQLVQSTGREVEESSKFLESMSEMIRKGIEEASQELQKENQVKLVQEGVLRQIPMVGSVLNWLAPVKEEVKGRSFNLTSGRITSTEDTYKFHVQVQEENSATSRSPRSSSSSLTSALAVGTESVDGEGSTTAGQVKAQLISQTPPTSPQPMAGPGINPPPMATGQAEQSAPSAVTS